MASDPAARDAIALRGVSEHNLAGVDVDIPHGLLTVVTGVSGSGKSSLVFDTLHAASQRRYLETLSGHARRFLQRLPSPRMTSGTRLSPTIALSQRRGADQPRSTVGTLSGVYDLLRFWFAAESGMEARDFSFVTAGACKACRGIGREDEVARDLLIADPAKTLRQGALVPTTPTGYIVYSQVTVDVLNTVCQAHGFDVDTPWQELTEEQQDVVFFGSDRVEVPFGKHSLESRMRWEGITAKPRELGHYKGLIPTIADILRRSRNENALRFARSVPCSVCHGTRLAEHARSVKVGGHSIDEVASWPLPQLRDWVADGKGSANVRASLDRRLAAILRLGLSHLSCDRATSTLSGGEHQRLRLATLATAGMAGVTFVFDEPSIGLHATEEAAVLDLLRELRDEGNTVVVVEHSEHALRAADHVVHIGPGAGVAGGHVIFAGAPEDLPAAMNEVGESRERIATDDAARIELLGATANNLQQIDAAFVSARLNVVSGVAGAGKSTLVGVLVNALRAQQQGRSLADGVRELRGADAVKQVVHVDQAPIGRTPRSNPATYTGMFDAIRKLFAALPASKQRGFQATTFSFNTKTGGRCPACEGSGREVVGMHGLPEVELVCATCNGRRFRDDVLEVQFADRASILDVLEATVDEACELFAGDAKVLRVLEALQRVGLGYLSLGQPATTLSGGEAQRVKLAGELARGGKQKTLFVLEEPTIGLHKQDVAQLLRALDELVQQGHTVVLVEHDLDVLRAADHIVDLGPGAGPEGGRVCGVGTAEQIEGLDVPTGRALREQGAKDASQPAAPVRPAMSLRGVSTHNLRDVDIDLPGGGFTVVTGVSGSGKSSLVFDTLHGESRTRMTEHLSGHMQRQLGSDGVGDRSVRTVSGLRPTIALAQQAEARAADDRRSTVATASGLHTILRTLWSRLAPGDHAADAFSWFRHEGACQRCAGDGARLLCDPERLIADDSKPLFDGGLRTDNKVVKDYADTAGRQCAIVRAVAEACGFDLSRPWSEQPVAARAAVMHGCGEREFDVVWQHGAVGDDAHEWSTAWVGIAGDIDREYARRQASGTTARAKDFAELLALRDCEACNGERLRDPGRSAEVGGRTLPQLCALTIDEVLEAVAGGLQLDARQRALGRDGLEELSRRLTRLVELGLGHLQLSRGAATLSAGERQRVRLARQLAAPLFGCAYVLDEPTLGLHARDVDGLLQVVRGLVDAGNAVVAVEHDMAAVAAADHVLEIGPGAGVHGGEVVASAPPAELSLESRTGRRLQEKGIAAQREPRAGSGELCIRGARLHHLQGVDVAFPLGCLSVVSGVSGSGKTSLVRGVIAASAKAGRAIECDDIVGLDAFHEVVEDAGARGQRVRTACPATLLSIFDEVRKQFAATDAARERGWRAPHFAYLGKSGGACGECNGIGRRHEEADFLGAGVWSVCEACGGRRYERATLEVTWCGMSIADVLESSIAALCERLESVTDVPAKILRALRFAVGLGLGYLRLGQGADTLSGGEAQRLHLVEHLAAKRKASLFLLDEPTRGLHPDDVDLLWAALSRLVEEGNTIIAVEHDLSMIARADHVVDLGPGAGAAGGRVLFSGAPQELLRCSQSATGQALAAK